MSRVTKEIAKAVAKGLTANHTAQIQKIEKRMGGLTVSHIYSETPKEVKEFYAKHPKYCNTRTGVYLRGNTIGSVYLNIDAVPWKGDNSTVIVPDELGRALMKLEVKKEGIQKAKNRLYREIEQTMLSLKTFKKVQEVFPEAVEFLPKGEAVYLPVVNLEGIRNELKVAFKSLADEQ